MEWLLNNSVGILKNNQHPIIDSMSNIDST